MPYIPNLTELRNRAKLSQSQLHRLADVDSATLARVEHGYSSMRVKCEMIIDGLNKAPIYAPPHQLTYELIVDGGKSGPFPGKKRKSKPGTQPDILVEPQ